MKPQVTFSPSEVAAIREQYAARTLDVRTWADHKGCSLETVRRVARGDTYRHTGGPAAHPAFGGLQGLARPAMPTLPAEGDGPSEADVAASLARLQAAMQAPTPEEAQSALAASLLDELQSKAAGQSLQPGNAKLG